MPDFLQSAPQKPKQNKMLAGVIFFVMLILGTALIGAVYYLEEQKVLSLEDERKALVGRIDDEQNTFDLEKDELELELETVKDELKVQENNSNSLKTFSDSIAVTAEIPSSWSMFKNPERVAQDSLPDLPTAALSPNSVAFGDNNFGQVDFYYAEDDLIDDLVEEEKGIEGVEISEETVSGEKVQVATYPLGENDEVTKETPGTKKYFIKLDQRVKTLIIVKQSKGDAEYEDAFDAFLSKIQIKVSQ